MIQERVLDAAPDGLVASPGVAIREGRWRCPYCSVVNRGAELACSGCGATRDKDVAFFLEDEAGEVTDEKLIARAEAGADWLCNFCQTSNRPEHDHCRNCGAEKGTSPSRSVRDVVSPPPVALAAPAPRPSGHGCAKWIVLALLLALGLCGVVSYFALRKTDDTVRVAGFSWSRTIDVDAYRTVRNQAWEGSVPANARVVSREQQVHHTDHVQTGTQKVKVGTKDMGNGFFKDVYENRPVYSDKPVYRYKVTYEAEAWVHERTAKASAEDHAPHWPAAGVGFHEREAGRNESYVVRLEGRGSYRMDLPEDRWASLQVGQRFHAVIQGGSKVLSIQ
jgi:hypothetical protein